MVPGFLLFSCVVLPQFLWVAAVGGRLLFVAAVLLLLLVGGRWLFVAVACCFAAAFVGGGVWVRPASLCSRVSFCPSAYFADF